MRPKPVIAAVLLVLIAARAMTQEHQHGTGEKLGAVHFVTSCSRFIDSSADEVTGPATGRPQKIA